MTTSIIKVNQLNNGTEKAEWDNFVEVHRDSLPLHRALWLDILIASYNFPCYFLYTRQDGQITGVLPLFKVKNLLRGSNLESLPGGICADTPEAEMALIEAADSLAQDLRVDLLFLRDSRSPNCKPGFQKVETHRGVKRSLTQDSEFIWNSLNTDMRKFVRSSRKHADLQIIIGFEGLEEVYELLSQSLREFGTPIFSYKFLQNVTHFMKKDYQIVRVYYDNKIVGGYYSFIFKQQIFGMWGGALSKYRDLKINYQVYWAMIESGCQSGYTMFDFNRSVYPSGQFDFKSSWGNSTYPIYQLYRSYRGTKPLEILASQETGQGSIGLVQNIWRRLPLSLTRILGPIVRRHIPFG